MSSAPQLATDDAAQEERLSRTMRLVPKAEEVVSTEAFQSDRRFPEAVRARVAEMKARDKELASSTLGWDGSGTGRLSRQQLRLRRKLELRNMERHSINPFANLTIPISMPEGTQVYAAMSEDSAGLEKMMSALVASMRGEKMATPLVTPIPTRPSEVQSWGSEGVNTAFGANEAPKPRWSVPSIFYQDVAALERFGVDPLNPPSGRGVVLSANSYGYPIDGYTTGYTVKLPPSGADPEVAQRTPISGNQPSVVASSNGEDASPLLGIPSDEPVADQIAGVDWSNPWRRGEAIRKLQEQQKAAELLNSQTITPEQKIALTRYLNNEYGAPPATLPEASDNGRIRRPPIVPPPERNYDAPVGAVPRFKSREPTAALKRTRTRIKKAAVGKVLTEEQAAARRAVAVPLPSEGDILMPQA